MSTTVKKNESMKAGTQLRHSSKLLVRSKCSGLLQEFLAEM